MPQPNKKSLGQRILDKCATNKNPLERDGCKLHLSASKIALVLDMDKDPVKSKMEDEGKRCDFAAYQRPNPINNRAHLALVEFKEKLHNVNEVRGQFGASLEFLGRLSGIPEFKFDIYAMALVCKGEIGPRKISRLKESKVLPRKGGVRARIRPLILVSGAKLTDKQIADNGQPWKPKAAKKRGKG